MPGLILPGLLGEDPGYDVGKVSWIGNIATSRHALAVKADSPYRTLEDLCSIGRPVKHSDNGRDTSSIAGELAFELVDCEHAGVTGYKGSTEAVLAVMRGEVDADRQD